MVKSSNKEFAFNLEKRTKKFAIKVIKVSSTIPKTLEGNVIKNQLTKSGTSVGANYREANRARSKADFRNKIKICESEASETQYWLEILKESGLLANKRWKRAIKNHRNYWQFSLPSPTTQNNGSIHQTILKLITYDFR